MSYWFEPRYEDLDITENGEELHAWLESDNAGNVYCSLKVADIEKLLKSVEKKKLKIK